MTFVIINIRSHKRIGIQCIKRIWLYFAIFVIRFNQWRLGYQIPQTRLRTILIHKCTKSLNSYFPPGSYFCIQIHTNAVSLKIIIHDKSTLIRIGIRKHIIDGFTATGYIKTVFKQMSALCTFVPPVIIIRTDISIFIPQRSIRQFRREIKIRIRGRIIRAQESLCIIEVSDIIQILFTIHRTIIVSWVGKRITTGESDFRFPFHTFFSSNHNYSIGSLCTIHSCRTCIFQDINRFNVIRIYRR